MAKPFLANEISGLASPTYNSGASNKKYVDDISGSIVDWASDTFYPSSLGNSISGSYYGHSSNTDIHFTKTSLDDDYSPSGTLGWSNLSGLADVSSQAPSEGDSLVWDGTSQWYPSSVSGGGGSSTLTALTDTNISSPVSGHILMYSGSSWANLMPPMTFNVANVKISSQENLNVTRFNIPANKNIYVWQASACGSGGTSISGLKIELLSGSTSIYSTSSATIQEGNPLAKTNGNIEIRFAYSGAGVIGSQFGTGFMNVSVY